MFFLFSLYFHFKNGLNNWHLSKALISRVFQSSSHLVLLLKIYYRHIGRAVDSHELEQKKMHLQCSLRVISRKDVNGKS